MNILDENILKDQRQLLQSWRISIHQIGIDIGRKGMKDDEIAPMLHKSRRPTFFTRDLGFFDRAVCHAKYAVVCLAVDKTEAAFFMRRFLRHPAFSTQAKRMGTVTRVSSARISVWRLHTDKMEFVDWHG